MKRRIALLVVAIAALAFVIWAAIDSSSKVDNGVQPSPPVSCPRTAAGVVDDGKSGQQGGATPAVTPENGHDGYVVLSFIFNPQPFGWWVKDESGGAWYLVGPRDTARILPGQGQYPWLVLFDNPDTCGVPKLPSGFDPAQLKKLGEWPS